MTNFFPGQTNTDTACDIARGALASAHHALVGAPLSACLSGSVLVTSSLATMVGACALGGAILIVPLMIAHKKLQYKSISPYEDERIGISRNWEDTIQRNIEITNINSRILFALRHLFVLGAACIGAALCGLAILAVAKAALIGHLTYQLIPILLVQINNIKEWLNPSHLRTTLEQHNHEDKARVYTLAF